MLIHRILVSGLINIETTLQVEHFPIQYAPVQYPFWGVNSTVSGVGFNISKALTHLGDQARLISLIGNDDLKLLVKHALDEANLSDDFIVLLLNETPQSVIIYDREGKRQIHVDLKNIQESVYPLEYFESAITDCHLAVLCNINFSRPLLELVRERKIPIATDVHTLADLSDTYNRDFMNHADILFMSDEMIRGNLVSWSRNVMDYFGPDVLVIGLGEKGALMATKAAPEPVHFPAVITRPVVNTIGAGDALFSAFIHYYLKLGNSLAALQRAMIFAGYKIGDRGAAQGFLTEHAVEEFFQNK